ncbi:MAG: oxidoreductase [Burkholderiaceae bacterium]
MMPTWFITGCSTGFGRELARAVLSRGWNVVVTARDPDTVADLVAGHETHALALRLDVTDAAQIAAAVSDARARFGSIDVLVNNAGYGYRSAVEEGEDEAMRRLFETNFFGLVAVTRAVLPEMRMRGSGWIVNLSSIAGRMSFPGSGYYSASKFAVEGLSVALSKELRPLGVRVLVVEPGPFRTDFGGRSLQQSRAPIADYAQTAGKRRKENVTQNEAQPGDPARAAEAIIEVLQSPTPPFRLLLGRVAVDSMRTELDAQRRELEAWEVVGYGADYPAAD